MRLNKGIAFMVTGALALAAGQGVAQAHDLQENGLDGGAAASSSFSERYRLFAEFPNGTTNSDIAFFGNIAYVGNYNGFRIFDITNEVPVLLSDVRCVGAQGDPSIVDRDKDGRADLLVLSVDRTMSGPNCAATPTAHDDPNGWEGLRLFDVSNPSAPQFITGIYQDCGSHTNTLLPTADGRMLVLNSSYPLRPGPTCGPERGPENGRDALHGVVQVVELDLANPAASREITELPITYPGDADNSYLPISEQGLNGGVVAPGLVDGMRACHDLSVFPDLGLVSGACAEQAQLWKIDKKTGLPDTSNPVWTYDQPNVDFWHSATFSWDGKVTNFIDESFGSGCPTKSVKTAGMPGAPREWETGNMFFLQTTSGRLLSEFRIPRGTNGGEGVEYCSSHLGLSVPAKDKYLLVNAYYRGGTSIIDYSNPYYPREVAFYDPPEADTWSAYPYERRSGKLSKLRTFSNDGVHTPGTGHGFQALEADVDADVVGLSRLNPQLQEQVIKTDIQPRGKAVGRQARMSSSSRSGRKTSKRPKASKAFSVRELR